MRLRNFLLSFVILVILWASCWFATLALAKKVSGQGFATPPQGWFEGTIPWAIDPEDELPETIEDLPGFVPGDIHVDIEGEITVVGSWAEARELIGGQAGALWYLPEGFKIFLPLTLKGEAEPITPPLGVCEGNVGWPVMATDRLPENDPCGSDSTWVIDNQGDLNSYCWVDARQAAGGLDATLWHQPWASCPG